MTTDEQLNTAMEKAYAQEIKARCLVCGNSVAVDAAAALSAHRREWADWLSNWDGAVCPERPTIAAVIDWLRSDTLPFGVTASTDGGRS